jgi:hypothetical protein
VMVTRDVGQEGAIREVRQAERGTSTLTGGPGRACTGRPADRASTRRPAAGAMRADKPSYPPHVARTHHFNGGPWDGQFRELPDRAVSARRFTPDEVDGGQYVNVPLSPYQWVWETDTRS